jgi:hypothetical protein
MGQSTWLATSALPYRATKAESMAGAQTDVQNRGSAVSDRPAMLNIDSYHGPQLHTVKRLQTNYAGGFSPCSFLCRYFRLSVVMRKASPMATGTNTADATFGLCIHPISWRPLKMYPASPLR